ncbi:MAG: RidA family protein [Candidatus Melainabacteria bacterium]|nr:RidA family protein [Candidatus Melainabacteria bacterium]
MAPEIIFTEHAPKAIGPYSQAVKANGFVYVSGQIPINPKSGELVKSGIADEVHQVMKNLSAIVEKSGSSLSKVLKTTIYLKDMNDFDAVNKVYGEYFTDHKPARACVQVAKLPKDVSVEIDAVCIC